MNSEKEIGAIQLRPNGLSAIVNKLHERNVMQCLVFSYNSERDLKCDPFRVMPNSYLLINSIGMSKTEDIRIVER